MTATRKQVIVRMPLELHATVKTIARRLGLSVNDYIVARVGADATERAGAAAVTDRIDALEAALGAALAERDDRIAEALDAVTGRLEAAIRSAVDGEHERTVKNLQTVHRSLAAIVRDAVAGKAARRAADRTKQA